MKTKGIIFTVLGIIAIAVAAVFFVKQKETIENNEAAIASLQEDLSATKDSENELKNLSSQQNEELSNILSELAAISGRTSSLKVDLESGSAEISTAQQIEESIKAIKNKIAALERVNSSAASKNKEFQKVIDNFKKVVEEQEAEISSLKEEIREKDKTIKTQQSTIDSQLQTIQKQKEDLEALVAKQAKSLYDAGAALEEIGDASPKVSWSNNKKKVGAMTQSIYKQALIYYQKALESGYAAARDRIDEIQTKITPEE